MRTKAYVLINYTPKMKHKVIEYDLEARIDKIRNKIIKELFSQWGKKQRTMVKNLKALQQVFYWLLLWDRFYGRLVALCLCYQREQERYSSAWYTQKGGASQACG